MATQHSTLDSKFPVLLPPMPELHLSRDDFDAFIADSKRGSSGTVSMALRPGVTAANRVAKYTEVSRRTNVSIRGRGRGRARARGGRSTYTFPPRPAVEAVDRGFVRPPHLIPPPPGFAPPAGFTRMPHPPFQWVLTPKQSSTEAGATGPASQSTTSQDEKLATTPIPGPFMNALMSHASAVPSLDERDGKMLTANGDVAFATSAQPLVDVFFELEASTDAARLEKLLYSAWGDDRTATLRLIWNARSIHLGKSNRPVFYRAMGWLAENHPRTLLVNLPWLVRPLIEKKPAARKGEKVAEKTVDEPSAQSIDEDDEDDDFEIIDAPADSAQGEPVQKKVRLDVDEKMAAFDVKFGGAHGYWKDLLNLLVLAAQGQLHPSADIRGVFNVKQNPKDNPKFSRDWTKGHRKEKDQACHASTVKKLEKDSFYKALHVSVARLFAEQLKLDLALLKTNTTAAKKRISFAAKWAPSHKGMHDQNTTIVSSIAEILYPREIVCPDADVDRISYLKHARIAYQSQTLSPLRKHLDIVERHITSKRFDHIKYDRIPSLAMRRYTQLFAKNDHDRFDQYIERVAQGQSKISGATLLPSTLIANLTTRMQQHIPYGRNIRATLIKYKLLDLADKVANGQWNTLVQRIRDAGTLSSSIAICDVSGSMTSPRFPDGTTPLDSAIGLSLLLAEVTAPPFGGAFITFSSTPEICRVGGPDDTRSLANKVRYISRCAWGMNTNFIAVFRDLILPLAIEHKIPEKDMVKRVFVFSDMHFDSADVSGKDKWSSSFLRLRREYRRAGYTMPELIFWNLAGEHTGTWGAPAPKPVRADEPGTALVSGYSQAQLRVFLDEGTLEDPAEGAEEAEEEKDGDTVVVGKAGKTKEAEKGKTDSMTTLRKAIGHPAYRMLKVID